MKKETKKELKMPLFKKEENRTKKEKLIRDIACYVVLIYVSVIVFLFANSQIKLANAQTEYVNSIVNIYRTIRCEKHLVHVSEDLDSPIAQVSRELKSDGVNYDVGQAADVICNLVAEAHNKERLVAEAGPPIELIRSSDEDWYLHL